MQTNIGNKMIYYEYLLINIEDFILKFKNYNIF